MKTSKMARIILLVFWCALIFFLSHQPILPSLDDGWQDFFFKKAAHFTVYFILYILARQAFDGKTAPRPMEAFVFGLLYAISDEYHQSFVPGRTPMVRDVVIDTAGLVAAMALYQKIHRRIYGSS